MQNRKIYTVKEGKSKDTKLRGLKGTNEDISISQETESKGTKKPQFLSQKVHCRTVSKDTKKPQSNCIQVKNPSQKCTLE